MARERKFFTAGEFQIGGVVSAQSVFNRKGGDFREREAGHLVVDFDRKLLQRGQGGLSVGLDELFSPHQHHERIADLERPKGGNFNRRSESVV